MDQKRSKRAKIYISRNFGHKNLVYPSFQSEIPCFNDCFIFISQFSEGRKCSKRTKRGRKGPKEVIRGQKGPIEPKSISHEPLVVETWQTPHFNQKGLFLLVYHIFHTSQMTGSAQKGPKCVKRDQNGSKGPKWVKRDQNGSKRAKIYISRTFGRRNLVDLSFQSEWSCFYQCFIYFIRFS